MFDDIPPHFSTYLDDTNSDLYYKLRDNCMFEFGWGNGNNFSFYIRNHLITVTVPRVSATPSGFTDILLEVYKRIKEIETIPKPEPITDVVDKDQKNYDFLEMMKEVARHKKSPGTSTGG